ncbi:MAG: phosphotransferase [Cyanobacteriota bacterium]|nr:phosphotransferase [Cyanobacteriota bacterium]
MLLSSTNVSDYLVANALCCDRDKDRLHLEPVAAKNFNLLVTFPDGSKLLVKQERGDRAGKTAGEFQQEWRMQQFVQQFPELQSLKSMLPTIAHFDSDNSILVCRYLESYEDLTGFYARENRFPAEIGEAIGTLLGTFHRTTFNRPDYQEFFSENPSPATVSALIQGLERITPEVFGVVPMEGLKFFALYQRYDSLGVAIASVGEAFAPSCVTHNDLKLNNLLLHNHWEDAPAERVRAIDWERSSWGDPAFDLGTLIASYLQIWLNSLVISNALSIEESLRLATTPLEQLQPSIAALVRGYLQTFPEILTSRPDFLIRTVQLAGFVLIQQIQATIQYQKSFGNMGICMLQVAKSLLCRPEQSMPTVFGSGFVRDLALSDRD